MENEVIGRLEDIVGKKLVVTNKEMMQDYLVDETAPTVCPCMHAFRQMFS